MRTPALLAALAASSSVSAQMGKGSLPIVSNSPNTTASIITSIPPPSTSTAIPVTETQACSYLKSPGFLPFQGVQAPPSAAPSSRVQRAQIGGPLDLLKRQAGAIITNDVNFGAQSGSISDQNGVDRPIEPWFTLTVWCPVPVTQNETEIYNFTGPDVTSTQQATGYDIATTTVTRTLTSSVFAPTPTFYAACQANNIVNHIDYDNNGCPMYFDRVYFGQSSTNRTNVNDVGVNAKDEVDCCIECHTAAEGCSEAFFVPARKKCQMRLRNPVVPVIPALPPSPGYGTPPSSASVALSVSTGGVDVNKVCLMGSLEDYVGVVRGRENFASKLAWSFINGPCGRLSVNTVPVDRPNNVTNGTFPSSCVRASSVSLPVAIATPAMRAIKLLSG